MLTPTTFTLFFSWRCNCACQHCGFSCGPTRRGSLSVEQSLSYIEEASRSPGLRMVAYSGGEPFLYYDRLLQCMSYAHGLGLSGGVVTNCFWAGSRRVAEARLDRLAQLGLEEVIVSLDDFHLQHVSLERFQRVVHAALEHGVRVGVNMQVVRNSRVRKAVAPELLALAPGLSEDPAKMWIREGSPLLVGRARSNLCRDDLHVYGEAQLGGAPCNFVVRNMVVTPDRSLYACCGFGDSSEDGPASIAYIGSLDRSSYGELLAKATCSLVLNVLATYGPWALLHLVQRAEPALSFRQEYVSNCDICDEISTNLPLRGAVVRALREMARSVSSLGAD